MDNIKKHYQGQLLGQYQIQYEGNMNKKFSGSFKGTFKEDLKTTSTNKKLQLNITTTKQSNWL